MGPAMAPLTVDRSGPWTWSALDLRGLAAFRIAVGAILVADALLRSRDVELMFAPDGIFPPALVRDGLGGPTAWSLAWLHESLAWGRCLLVLEGLAGIAMACGWQTRWATLAAWVLVVSIVRRTAPATNAGDLWLGCLLLWGCFLPLGAAWSWDARRTALRGFPPGTARTGPTVASAATAALLLQIAAVYLAAGLAKCNDVWLAGDAVSHALSVHDHGTRLGQSLATLPWLTAPAGWLVVIAELAAAPLLVAFPSCRARARLAGAFVLLHAAIWLVLSVGLFAPVGIAAWLAAVPGCVWDRISGPWPGHVASAPAAAIRPPGLGDRLRHALLVGLMVVAAASYLAALRAPHAAVPGWLRFAIRLTALEQDWAMFGDVRRQAQWVRAVATLADGAEVDLLRGGTPCTGGLPVDGYLSLPHHRWHKLCWDLHRPVQRRFAPSLAASLARHWNRSHPAATRAVAVEIRNGRVQGGTTEEIVLGSWPPRSARGAGNLDRFLREEPPGEDHAAGGTGEDAPPPTSGGESTRQRVGDPG